VFEHHKADKKILTQHCYTTSFHPNKFKQMNNRYMMRGVSAAKEDVHNAIKNIDKGVFPQAFCKIIPDILGGDDAYCNIMHADGAGTK